LICATLRAVLAAPWHFARIVRPETLIKERYAY